MEKEKTFSAKDLEIFEKFYNDPVLFAKIIFKIEPQPAKPEYASLVNLLINNCKFDEIKAEYFGDYDSNTEKWNWYCFERDKYITWQQWVILETIKASITKKIKRKITIRSGHGTGKTSGFVIIIYWFLFTREFAQIACTASTSYLLKDVLFKELATWLQKLNKINKTLYNLFELTELYLRVKASTENWFCRGRTCEKSNPEALTGVHGKHVMILVDEASGVPQETFIGAMGSLTDEDVIMVLISNPRRLDGFFAESFKKAGCYKLHFNSLESPILSEEFKQEIIDEFGKEGDEYRYMILGEFPRDNVIDKDGWRLLYSKSIIDNPETYIPAIEENETFSGPVRMGIDPSGEGNDETTWIIRDNFKARVVLFELKSSGKSIASKTLGLKEEFNIPDEEICVDNFGVGVEAIQELAGAGCMVNSINLGDKSNYPEQFINKRAESYHQSNKWFKQGGKLVDNKRWKPEMKVIYTRVGTDKNYAKNSIMSKKEMRKRGYKSPNAMDGLALTFVDGIEIIEQGPEQNNCGEINYDDMSRFEE
ncbi:MAG TPA: hypothetical protein PKY81_15890 [bacterium]|nr:hypothetical protein [bacterium]